MAYSIANNPLLRKNFAKIKKIIDIPNLIDIQKNSYKRFLQIDIFSYFRRYINLEESLVGIFLYVNQIGYVDDFLDLGEVLA